MVPEWVFVLTGLCAFALPGFLYFVYGGQTDGATDPVTEEVRARQEREERR